jgi:hypothetical protein
MKQRFMQCAIAAGIAAFLTIGGMFSCSDTTEPIPTGTLRMNLVDAPTELQSVDSLIVVFEKVLVHKSSDAESPGDGWIVVLDDALPVEARTFDLLQLVNGVFVTLGEVELEATRYTQVRIMFESATLFVDGVPQVLTIPSGDQTGIKLIRGFTVEPDVVTEVVADFDAASSLHENPPGSGEYFFRPTIRLVQKDLTGTISGTITPAGIGAVLFAINPASGDTVTTTLADPASGDYLLQTLMAGTYDVSADAVGYAAETRSGITVTAGSNTPGVDFELAPSSN